MAVHPDEVQIKLLVDVSVTEARSAVKRLIVEANRANRALAALEERLELTGSRLAEYGIKLEVGRGG